MICYHNLGEIAHDVVTACLVRIGIKKRARCCDYWELALNNGVQYSTSIGIYCVGKMDVLLRTAAIITAISIQVMLGADTPFRADLHRLRPHRGAQQVAQWLFSLMAASPI